MRNRRSDFGILGLAGVLSLVTLPNQKAISAEATVSEGIDTGQIEEIVVTAQKRKELLQDVPAAVEAFNPKNLENSGVVSALDLGQVVPSLQMVQNTGSIQPFLRGIGNIADTPGNDASVATYVDGIYYSRINPAMLQFSDIERVEVLKGPQGTLFGRNADGGLINIITQDPSFEPTGKILLGYGNYDTFNANVYYSMGFGSRVAGDISIANTTQHKGWGRNIYSGKQYNYEDDTAIRSKWIANISDDTQFKLILNYDYQETTEGLTGLGIRGTTQGSSFGQRVLPEQVGFYNINFPPNLRDVAVTRDYGISGVFTHDFGFATLTDTLGLNETTQSFAEPTANPYLTIDIEHVQEWSNELQLASKSGNPVDWIGGFYYLNEAAQIWPLYLNFFGSLSSLLGAPNSQIEYFGRLRDVSYAGYGQTTYHVTDTTEVTLGARYTLDHVGEKGFTKLSTTAFSIYEPLIKANVDFPKLTYKVAIDHHFTRDLMAYLSVSNGFKAGTYNILPVTTEPAARPESLTAYELGVKSELLDRRLRLNAAIFYYSIRNPQIMEVVGDVGTLVNAGAADDKGFEFDGQASVTKELSTHFGMTLLDARYTSFRGAPYYDLNPNPPYGLGPVYPGNATNNHLINAPTLSFNVGLDYSLPTRIGDWQYSVSYAYQSHYYFTPQNSAEQRPYGLLNMSLSFVPEGYSNWRVRVWGRNLTNEKYYMSAIAISGAFGYATAPGAPLTFGSDISYQF